MLDEELPLTKVAERFNVSARTIRNWIVENGFPRPYYIGRKPFFRWIEVQLWREQQWKNTDPPPKSESEQVENRGKTGKRL